MFMSSIFFFFFLDPNNVLLYDCRSCSVEINNEICVFRGMKKQFIPSVKKISRV